MIGKPITGRSFSGCIRYLLEHDGAHILAADGLRTDSPRAITAGFNQQRKLNPNLGKAVGHTVLSWSPEDSARLSDGVMVEVAGQYMEKMGITGTQFLVVRHTDRPNPHLHLVYNRVANDGRTITDRNNYHRNVRVCRELTERYGFYISPGKAKVNRQRLRGSDRERYSIHDAVQVALKDARSWPQFAETLTRDGIGIRYKRRGTNGPVQGISFEMAGVTFRGSAIDRSLSFGKLEALLGAVPGAGTLNVGSIVSGENATESLPGSSPSTSQQVQVLGSHQHTGQGTLLGDEHLYQEPVPVPGRKKRRRKKRGLGL